ncbi:MAG: L,D-transpeptidase [Pseudomonadota bacterium]
MFAASGCNSPPDPPEIDQAHRQDQLLWRAGAHIFLKNQYDDYSGLLKQANANFTKERSDFVLFIDYEDIVAEYRRILAIGNDLNSSLEALKEVKFSALQKQLSDHRARLKNLKHASSLVNEGRLARKSLTKAELLLTEVQSLYERGDILRAEDKIVAVPPNFEKAEAALMPIIGRYADKDQVKKWRAWVDSTIAESRETRSKAIIVNKIKKTLHVYNAGKLIKSYPVELGRNGAKDKLQSGDQATPEGKYKITKKNPSSKFYKSLMINYPNEDDIKAFRIAKQKGLVSKKASIGNLIAIHGGGDDSMTYGCVSMKNSEIEELYNMVEVGTPVTIVGADEIDNPIYRTLRGS